MGRILRGSLRAGQDVGGNVVVNRSFAERSWVASPFEVVVVSKQCRSSGSTGSLSNPNFHRYRNQDDHSNTMSARLSMHVLLEA